MEGRSIEPPLNDPSTRLSDTLGLQTVSLFESYPREVAKETGLPQSFQPSGTVDHMYPTVVCLLNFGPSYSNRNNDDDRRGRKSRVLGLSNGSQSS